jgi:hypothetical protein
MFTIALTSLLCAASKKPLQVIVMAGQSNMVGHGYAEGSQLHWNASSTASCGGTTQPGCVESKPNLPPNLNGSLLTPEYAFLRNSSGGWASNKGVWIVYNESSGDSGLPGGFPTPGPSGGYWHGELSVGCASVSRTFGFFRVRDQATSRPLLFLQKHMRPCTAARHLRTAAIFFANCSPNLKSEIRVWL